MELNLLPQLIVFVFGGGAREHVLVRWLSRSNRVKQIFISHPNPGACAEPKCCWSGLTKYDHPSIIAYCRAERVNLVVVGPEDPLADGLVDDLLAAGIFAYGPSRAAAQLEVSKTFTMERLAKWGVPIPQSRTFSVPDASAKNIEQIDRTCAAALEYAKERGFPCVVKADGLCAGKGVTICADEHEAKQAIAMNLQDRKFGDASATIVIQEFLGFPGVANSEASIVACVAKKGTYVLLPPTQDNKHEYDGRTGEMTGGMGCTTLPWMTEKMMELVRTTIVEPIIAKMIEEGTPFTGTLYIALIWTPQGPKVIEINVRFPDPETEILYWLVDPQTDMAALFYLVASGQSLEDFPFKIRKGSACCVVMASHGYPRKAEMSTGAPITLPGSVQLRPGLLVFHSGTKTDGATLLTNGGRVLVVSGFRPDSGSSGSAGVVYTAVQQITWTDGNGKGPKFRTDIGKGIPAHLPGWEPKPVVSVPPTPPPSSEPPPDEPPGPLEVGMPTPAQTIGLPSASILPALAHVSSSSPHSADPGLVRRFFAWFLRRGKSILTAIANE